MADENADYGNETGASDPQDETSSDNPTDSSGATDSTAKGEDNGKTSYDSILKDVFKSGLDVGKNQLTSGGGKGGGGKKAIELAKLQAEKDALNRQLQNTAPKSSGMPSWAWYVIAGVALCSPLLS